MKRKNTYVRRRAVGAKKKRLMKKTVKVVDTAHMPAEVLAAAGELGSYGTASSNGAVGSWSRAKGNKPFSDRFFCKDRWTTQYQNYKWGATASALSFRANSTYDPQYIIAMGQQSAEWFPTLGEIYGNFRVHASSIHIDIDMSQGNIETFDEVVFGVWPSIVVANTVLSCPQSLSALRMWPNVKLVCVGPTTSGCGVRKLSHYMKIGDLIGVDNISSNLGFSGSYYSSLSNPASDPILEVFWNVVGFSTTVGPLITGCNMGVTIKYDVESYNLKYTQQFQNGLKGGPGDQEQPSTPIEDTFERMEIVYPKMSTEMPSSAPAKGTVK